MAIQIVENDITPSSVSTGATVDGGATAPSEHWGEWKLLSGGFKVTHGAYFQYINNNSPSDPPSGYPPVGWAIQGTLYVPSGVTNVQVFAYAVFETPDE